MIAMMNQCQCSVLCVCVWLWTIYFYAWESSFRRASSFLKSTAPYEEFCRWNYFIQIQFGLAQSAFSYQANARVGGKSGSESCDFVSLWTEIQITVFLRIFSMNFFISFWASTKTYSWSDIKLFPVYEQSHAQGNQEFLEKGDDFFLRRPLNVFQD